MAKSVEAIVEPGLLIWARQRAGYPVEDAAKKAQIPHQRLASWERGDSKPTVAQLKKLAEVYKRPLSVFYLAQPPKDFDPLHDFRRVHGARPVRPSPQLLYEIRRAYERRDLAVELFELAEGHKPAALPLRQTPQSDPDLLATEIRRFLAVDRARQAKWGSADAAFRHWRSALEERLVLVFQAPRIELDEMRGFSIGLMPFPAIVLNTRDSIAGRVFTMLHELCHIVIRQPGLCDLGANDVEVYCNRVAGAVLVPAQDLESEPELLRPSGKERWLDTDLAALAKRYGVSREMILRRLLITGHASERFYRLKRAEWAAARPDRARAKGGPPPHLLAISRGGTLFTRLVLSSYRQENITASDVADFLSVQLKHLPRIEAEVRMPRAGAAV